MHIHKLEDLFHETLKDLYYVEKTLVKTLPKLAAKANSQQLKDAFAGHLKETEGHVQRLERIFSAIGQKPSAKKCEALDGLIREADELMSHINDARTLDAAIISSAQAVEHYEIARYETLACWADELGYADAKPLLEKTLEEEKGASGKMTALGGRPASHQAAA